MLYSSGKFNWAIESSVDIEIIRQRISSQVALTSIDTQIIDALKITKFKICTTVTIISDSKGKST